MNKGKALAGVLCVIIGASLLVSISKPDTMFIQWAIICLLLIGENFISTARD